MAVDFRDRGRAAPAAPGSRRRGTLLGVSDSKGNGHDPLAAQMVAVLERIEGEIRGMRKDLTQRIDQTNKDLTELRSELVAFKDEVRGELTDIRGELREIHHEIAETNTRVSRTNEALTELRTDVHELRGEVRTMSDYGARILRLEDAVFKRTGT